MLLLKIKKNLSLLLPKTTTTTNLFNLVHFLSSSSSSSASASATKTLNPSPNSHPITEFLINSCGFSSQKAASATKRFSKFDTVEQAVSVRHFLKHIGFADTSICKLIAIMPRVLCTDVEKNLRPNLQTLCRMGFTEGELQLLVVSNPGLLVNRLTIPRLEFWQTFLRLNSRKDLVTVLTKNVNLISHNIDSGVIPKIALLKEYGLPETNIILIVKRGVRVINISNGRIEALLKRVNELGFDPKTRMFGLALSSLSKLGRDTFEAKMEIFKDFGWSEEQLLAALKKAPNLVNLSKENILEKMEFLAGQAGCRQSYIASKPVLLLLSLEKRLKPRHYVMEVFKVNNIVARWGLSSIMRLAEKKFVETFILPYKEQVPEIHEIYISACAGQMPL